MKSNARPRQRLNPDARKAQLLKCAMQAYGTTGVERAGHGDVAKLAGVSTATVFNYFPTREDLTNAVFDYIKSRVRNLFESLPPMAVTASEQIRTMAMAYERITDNEPDMAKVFLNWSVAFGPEVRPQFLEFQDEILTEITKRLPGGRQDRSDARVILAAADMFTMMKLDRTDPETIARFVNRVADALD